MEEVRGVLLQRGVDCAFSGNAEDVVTKSVLLLGGEVTESGPSLMSSW